MNLVALIATHALVGVLAFTAGLIARHLFGPHLDGDRRAGPGRAQWACLPSGSGTTVPASGVVEGPTPPASIPVAPRFPRTGTRGWDLAPTHPAAPRPDLYDWEAEGVA